jgi:hypothetical protein
VRRTESEMEIFYRAWVLRARWWRTVFARALKWRGRLALGPYQGDVERFKPNRRNPVLLQTIFLDVAQPRSLHAPAAAKFGGEARPWLVATIRG